MKALTRIAVSFLFALGAVACGNSTATAPTTVATSPASDTFASLVAPGGSTSRTFSMSTAGIVKVTLATLGNGAVSVGLGVGLPATGSPCSLAQSVVTSPGASPQIVTSADAGTYCVEVFDTGRLSENTPFSLTIEHP
jgi:hypothetical protein